MRASLSFSLVALLACTPAGDPVDPPPSWRYVALGDSVAAGTESATSYPRELASLLRTEGVALPRLCHLAEGGQVSGELLESLRAAGPVRRAVASADLVTITVGANDLLAMHERFRSGDCEDLVCYREETAAVIDRWEAILDEVLGLLRPGARLVVTNYYDPYVGNPRQQREHFDQPYPRGAREIVEALNGQLCTAASLRDVPCADLHGAFNGRRGGRSPLRRGLLADDGFHPSAEGHRLIARRILGAGSLGLSRDGGI